MSNERKKVLLIGASGAVGMATRDAIKHYLGADVITFDRPITGTPAEIAKKEADRAEKRALYQRLVEINGQLLDGEQAKWLLKDSTELGKDKQGHTQAIDDYKTAIRDGVDALVITAGVPRKVGMERKELLQFNTVIFAQYGKELADLAAAEIEKNPKFHLPVIFNAGNPVDTMTEVLGRELHRHLAEHAKEALNNGNQELAKLLAAEARSLKGKIIGQGGVLDGARGASAILDETRIPLADIIDVPVVGTHNANMVVDFDHAKVRHDGREIPLMEHPRTIAAAEAVGGMEKLRDKITQDTRNGGTRIAKDYQTILDVDQSAVLATGAALMKMVDAVINDKKIDMPAAIYNFSTDERQPKGILLNDNAVMGTMAMLGKNGATYTMPSNPALVSHVARQARKDYGDVKPYIAP